MVRDFQEYVEPGEDFPASPQRRNTSLQEDKDDSVILPLGADTLTCNLGIPVVVVCTKVCFAFQVFLHILFKHLCQLWIWGGEHMVLKSF